MLAVVFADFVDRHDVRMLQVRNGLSLGMEALDLRRAGQDARLDHLQRHRPVKADLARLIHHPHATAGEQLQQFVIAEAGEKCMVGS
jgi:hypothetical protein